MYINIVNFFLKLWGGAENNPVRSSIIDQCYFNAKYDKNASTRTCFFLNFSWSKITHSYYGTECRISAEYERSYIFVK